MFQPEQITHVHGSDVVWADVAWSIDSERHQKRPCIVLSKGITHFVAGSTALIAGIFYPKNQETLKHHEVSILNGGLNYQGRVNTTYLYSVDGSRILKKIGAINDELYQSIVRLAAECLGLYDNDKREKRENFPRGTIVSLSGNFRSDCFVVLLSDHKLVKPETDLRVAKLDYDTGKPDIGQITAVKPAHVISANGLVCENIMSQTDAELRQLLGISEAG